MHFIHKQVFKWMLLALAIFFIGHYAEIDKNVCDLCYQISVKLWFIEDMAIASSFTSGTRLQWIFLTLSCPLISAYFILKVEDVKHGDMSIKIPILMTCVGAFVVFGLLIEKDKTSQNGYWGLFLHSQFISSIMSFVLYYVLALCTTFTGLYCKAFCSFLLRRA